MKALVSDELDLQYREREIRGTVTSENTLFRGSEIEHSEIFIKSDAGETLRLRRDKGNIFHDPALMELVGKHVRARGVKYGRAFLISSWEEMP